ncbi:MAG: ComEA family DNA-binding protein [Vulcanimicrobiota bacterium]
MTGKKTNLAVIFLLITITVFLFSAWNYYQTKNRKIELEISEIKEESIIFQGEPININTASKDQLIKLPGIGDERARSIIEYRNRKGLFKSEDDIKKVNGIGEGVFKDITPYIYVETKEESK